MQKLKGLKAGDYKTILMKRMNFWEICPNVGKFEMARLYYVYRIKAVAYSKLLLQVYEDVFSV